MQVGNLSREKVFDFLGSPFFDVDTNDQSSPWRKSVSGSTPGVVAADGGAAKLELTSFNGAQSAALSHNDVLSFDIDKLNYLDIVWSLTMTGTVPDIAFGLASTGKGETAVSGLENALLFRVTGAGLKLKAHARLGTDAAVEESSNQVIGGGEILQSRISLESGVGAFAAVATSPKAGKGAVEFFSGDPANGRANEKLVSKQFDLSGYSGSLQPVALVAKASGAETAVLKLHEFRVGYNVA